jgi:hypothetical protein
MYVGTTDITPNNFHSYKPLNTTVIIPKNKFIQIMDSRFSIYVENVGIDTGIDIGIDIGIYFVL